MLSSLSKYYDYLCQQENSPLSPKGYSKVAINFNMILKNDGTLKDIIPYTQKVIRKGKEVDAPIEEQFPFRYSVPATSAEIIDHREKYNFGLVWDKKEEKLVYDKKSIEAFEKNKEKNSDFLSNLDSPVINAYKNFLSNWNPLEQTQNETLLKLGKDYSNAKFIVSVEYCPDFLHTEDDVKQKWETIFFKPKEQKEEEQVQCSISGKYVPLSQIPKTHTKLKGINGGLATGVGVVSFNSDAFCSYNKEQSQNSFVSNEIMEKYTEAFNYLSSTLSHKQMIDDMTLLFWAMTKENETPYIDAFSNSLGFGFNADKSEEEKLTSEKLNENLSKIFSDLANGKKVNFENLDIEENTEFYILGVKPNTSRLAIKVFEHNTFGNMMKNIAIHHDDFSMSDEDRQLAIWQIQKELKSPVANNVINPDLSIKMLQSILTNSRYPHFLLDNIICRIKTDKDDKKFIAINKNRVRIIRACLIRFNKIERGAYKMLNKENKDPAYNCGRLFAVLEAVQSAALPGINATIKDRFFSASCSTPYLAFPRLLKLSQNHFSKLEGGLKVHYEKMIGEVMDNLEDTLPKTLNMENQGVFVLGYYHQRQSFFVKNNKEEKGE